MSRSSVGTAIAVCLVGCGGPSLETLVASDGTISCKGPSPGLKDGFAEEVFDFSPGESAGFGADALPAIALGAPQGGGAQVGSLDVVSLGRGGSITLRFAKGELVDGEGPDFNVFENPFVGWQEFGRVEVSCDGERWFTFDCDPLTGTGCVGKTPVISSTDSGVSPFNRPSAGGDVFDLQPLGVQEAIYVRVTDTSTNAYAGTSGGFDLDTIVARR